MFRDNRDPETIGKGLLELHKLSPTSSISSLADQYLQPGTAHRLYGESQKEFESRLRGVSKPLSTNGKLAA